MSIWASSAVIEDALDFEHSGVKPTSQDARDSMLGLAYIPRHVFNRRMPYVRVSMTAKCYGCSMQAGEDRGCHTTLVLTRKQAKEIRDSLTEWLDGGDR